MRFACFVLLLSAVAISAFQVLNPSGGRPALLANKEMVEENPDFQELVRYLGYNMSPDDIFDNVCLFPEAVGEEFAKELFINEARPRSISSAIPWNKITDAVKKMAKSNSKFSKVLNLVNDPKFRELVAKTVNSHTLAEFVKDVAEHGFSWTEFWHLLLHALCSAATTIQHDKYSVGVCQILKNL